MSDLTEFRCSKCGKDGKDGKLLAKVRGSDYFIEAKCTRCGAMNTREESRDDQ